MKTVQDILDHKGIQVHRVDPTSVIKDAAALMANHKIGALVVCKGDEVVGLLDDRVIVRAMARIGADVVDAIVSEHMYASPPCVHVTDTIEHCMRVMTDLRMRYLPVTDQNRHLQGIISIGDVVKARSAEREFMIDQLANYIDGGFTPHGGNDVIAS